VVCFWNNDRVGVRWIALSAMFAVGCLETGAVECDDGRLCPAGRACDERHGGCVHPQQLEECDGAADLSTCSYPGVDVGVCNDQLCVPAGCGNGIVEEELDEMCDEGDVVPLDGCSADCRSTEECGNGVVDPIAGEACDDGNTEDGDLCHSDCTNPTCGDGFWDPMFDEECDDGDANGDAVDGCRTNCRVAHCGDHVTDTGEVCDDGNLVAGDQCTPDCGSDESCGNGISDFFALEQCDDGAWRSHDGCASSCQLESATWGRTRTGAPPQSYGAGMVYDAARQRVIRFGGFDGLNRYYDETWEWNGEAWARLPTSPTPPGRAGQAMAYDGRRGRTVLFGGGANGPLGDTWEWDGTRWLLLTPASAPPPRQLTTAAYDSRRGVTVVFGGFDGSQMYGDTWEWNGTNWSHRTSAHVPAARFAGTLAYDPSRGVTVLFGGQDASGAFGDTWEWDGIDWHDRTLDTTEAPSARMRPMMAFDPSCTCVVLYGGLGATSALDDVWRWNGDEWTEPPAEPTPPARTFAEMVTDLARARIVLVYGFDGAAVKSDLWEHGPDGWDEVTPLDTAVEPYDQSVAYDARHGRGVMLGRFLGNDLLTQFRWDGRYWRRVTDLTDVVARRQSPIVYDARRDRVVMFGGDPEGSGEYWGDTQEWNEELGWDDVSPPPEEDAPTPRNAHAMAYDHARGVVVLFGGNDAGPGTLGDTWIWDGAHWTDMTPSGSPPPRFNASMTYDAARERVILHGGFDANGRLGDTWEWDGSIWTDRTAPTTLTAREGAALAYDAGRRRTVLFGGSDPTARNDTWEWDGTEWKQLVPPVSPSGRTFSSAMYDAARQQIVIYGGSSTLGLDETWTWRWDSDEGADVCADARDLDGDGLAGCADPDCWAMCTPLCAPGATCDPAWPRCGDDTCDPTESCRLCPADCGTCAAVCGDVHCDLPETSTSCPGDCW
jgi:cysteine-rich repeat protein